MEELKKPTFREEGNLIFLDNAGLIFNAQKFGPTTFAGLRNANYAQGFKMPTMPNLVQLVHASLENQNYRTAEEVINTIRNFWLTGNTVAHYFEEGLFIEDNPKMHSGRIVRPDFKTLESRLGKHEERGVVFSDDKEIRFTPYNYTDKIPSNTLKKFLNTLELVSNSGVIALVGGEENAEKMGKISEHHEVTSYLKTLFDVDFPETRVGGLHSRTVSEMFRVVVLPRDYFYRNKRRFFVSIDLTEYYDDRCSFGVKETK
jgi:hypothetical protein